MAVDKRTTVLEDLRQGLHRALYPFYFFTGQSLISAQGLGEFLNRQKSLQEENQALRARVTLLSSKIASLEMLTEENRRLRALLGAKEEIPVKGILAELVGMGRNPFLSTFILDKGEAEGLKEGWAVIDEKGLLARIVQVAPHHAEAIPITDSRALVPVMNLRNGLLAVAQGDGKGMLSVLYQAPTQDYQVGDRLVTSGLDEVFAQGIPVAEVTDVQRNTGNEFMRIQARVFAEIGRHRLLVVLAQPHRVISAQDVASKTVSSPKAQEDDWHPTWARDKGG